MLSNAKGIGRLMLALTLGASGVTSAQTSSPASPPPWVAPDAYLDEVREIGQDAAKLLWATNEPIFRGQGLYAVGGIPPTGKVSIAILFPTAVDTPEYQDKSGTYSFCRTITPTAEMKMRAQYVIACDPEAIRILEILVRLTHSQKFKEVYLRNDWAFMQALKRIETDPVSLVKEMGAPSAADGHIRSHMSLILAYLYAHEAWHLTHGIGTYFDDSAEEPAPANEQLLEIKMCRNYDEFKRQGFSLYEKRVEPLKDEGTTEDPSLRPEVQTTRRIWQEELDADRYAARNLVSLMTVIHDDGGSEEDLENTFLQVLEDFADLAMLKWQSKMIPFADNQCRRYAGKDFYLTPCMCESSTKRYSVATRLLAETHPPIALRMQVAGEKFINGVGSHGLIKASLDGNDRMRLAIAWYTNVRAMIDVPMKMAMTECGAMTRKAGRVTTVFPDLAGFWGPNGSHVYLGYPANEEPLYDGCGAGLAPPELPKK